MSSAYMPFFLALLQVTSAAPATSSPDISTHNLQKRLATGSTIAIGICVPALVLVVGLGLGILYFYPEQRRKLRAQNARREADLANREQRQRQGSEHTTLPVYKEQEDNEYELEDEAHGNTQTAPTATTASATTAQPSRTHITQSPTDARHAALTV